MSDLLQAITKLSPGKRLAAGAMVALVLLTWIAVCLVLVGVIGP
jgi:hypothetical protein